MSRRQVFQPCYSSLWSLVLGVSLVIGGLKASANEASIDRSAFYLNLFPLLFLSDSDNHGFGLGLDTYHVNSQLVLGPSFSVFEETMDGFFRTASSDTVLETRLATYNLGIRGTYFFSTTPTSWFVTGGLYYRWAMAQFERLDSGFVLRDNSNRGALVSSTFGYQSQPSNQGGLGWRVGAGLSAAVNRKDDINPPSGLFDKSATTFSQVSSAIVESGINLDLEASLLFLF